MISLAQKISSVIKRQIGMLLEPIIGYSRVVSVTKASLLVVAFILTSILIILPFYNSVNKNFRITFSGVEKSAGGSSPIMQNPHLQGVDSNDHTYNIIAKTAVQNTADNITLKDLNADINLRDDGWISVSADTGFLDHAKNILKLEGNINAFSHEGYEISTTEAYINMKDSSMHGEAPVEGQGPIGTLRADNFVVDSKGTRILLTGHVKLVIFKNNEKKPE